MLMDGTVFTLEATPGARSRGRGLRTQGRPGRRRIQFPLMPAASMIGHYFSISALAMPRAFRVSAHWVMAVRGLGTGSEQENRTAEYSYPETKAPAFRRLKKLQKSIPYGPFPHHAGFSAIDFPGSSG
jgi:hypothetical protein